MKRLLLLLLFAVAAFGQPAAPVVTVAADPSGNCVAHVSQQFNERNGKQWACVDTTGIGFGTWTWINQGTAGGVADPGANGVMKRTALDVTAPAAASDILGPFTGAKDVSHCAAGDGTMQACGSSGSANPAEPHTVTFSTMPTFTCSSATAGIRDTFILSTTLTANITASTLSGCTPGQELNFLFQEDATGGRTVALPTGFSQVPGVCPIANSITKINVWWDGTTAQYLGGGTDICPGILTTQTAPSGNPPSGSIYMWADSTNNTVGIRDSSGNISWVPRAEACTNQVVTALGTNGRITCAAPFTLTTTGTSGAASFAAGTLNIPQYAGGSSTFSTNQGPTAAITETGSAVNVYQTTSVPALAAGKCYNIELGYGFGGGASATTLLVVDSTTVLMLGSSDTAADLTFHFEYCNDASVQNTQHISLISGGYNASNTTGTGLTNYFLPAPFTAAAANIDWSTSHTISLTSNAPSGTVTGHHWRIQQ